MTKVRPRPLLADTLTVMLPDERDTALLRICLSAERSRFGEWSDWLRAGPNVQTVFGTERRDLRSLLPLLAQSLGDEGGPEIQPLLRAAVLWEAQRCNRISEIMAQVIDVLEGAVMQPLVFGGVSIAETVYPDRSKRHTHDAELYVAPPDIQPAAEALLAAGFVPAAASGIPGSIALAHRDGFPVNLRSRFLTSAYYALPEVEMAKRSVSIEVAGRQVRGLRKIDELLLLCAHVASGIARPPAEWVVDAAMLLSRLELRSPDWGDFIDDARSGGLSLPTYVVLTYLNTELGAPLPRHVASRLADDASRIAAPLRDAALFYARTSARGRLSRMIAKSRWKSRVAIARSLIAPSPTFLREWCVRRELPWSPLWYLGRPLRRVVARSGLLRRSA